MYYLLLNFYFLLSSKIKKNKKAKLESEIDNLMNDLSYKKKTQIKKLREKSYKRNPRSLKLNNLKKNLSSSINLNNDCQNFGKSFLKPDYSFKNNYSLRKDFLIKDVKNLIFNNKDTKNISKMNKRNN